MTVTVDELKVGDIIFIYQHEYLVMGMNEWVINLVYLYDRNKNNAKATIGARSKQKILLVKSADDKNNSLDLVNDVVHEADNNTGK